MKRIVVSVLLPLLLACGTTDPNRPPEQITSLPRDLTADERRVADATNHFAFTLFQRLSAQQPDANVFVSPFSVSMSLGMAMNGASGETLNQMRATLGFGPATLAEINKGYQGLFELESGLDPSTTFEIANSVWHRQTIPFHQSFFTSVKDAFDADVRASPFDQTTITAVNGWVNEKTNGRITEILKEIQPEHVMFLINAIYFKGSWRDGFDPAKTADGPFITIDGTEQMVKLMRRDKGVGTIRYRATSGTEVGELSYGNGAFVMTVLVPHAQNANVVAAGLDTASWRNFISDLGEIEGEVILPRFSMEYERELAQDLQALGMQVPFHEVDADFSGMSPMGQDMYIAFVKHKTFVRVDEVGTEAAAVTNTGIGLTSLPPGLRATKPFIFVIRERFSGTILFMGKIVRIPPA